MPHWPSTALMRYDLRMGQQEYVILVDDDDYQIGTAEKLDAHRSGALHRAFSILIWRRDGRMLLQQRASSKYHSGGLWSNACCGHPRPGEDVERAAQRRLNEEMGFVVPLVALGTFRYRADFADGLSEHEIVHVYRGVYDGAVLADPTEAEAVAWLSIDDVRDQVALSPDRFSIWFRHYVQAEWPTA